LRINLGRRHGEEAAVNPDRAAEQVVLDLSAQRLNNLLPTDEVKRYHVDDDIRLQVRDLRAKLSELFFCCAIERYVLDLASSVMGTVGFAVPRAYIHDLMSKLDKPGHQVASDVTTTTDDDDA
jgi:hypothetical protein